MFDPRHRPIAIILFVLLCGLGSLYSVWLVRDWGNELSIADPYSEANALREVENFRERGLTENFGLGNVYHIGMYPTEGFEAEPDVSKYGVSADGVYTHYPPGPEYLLYAAAKLLGPEPVSRLRLVPIGLGWAAMTFFGLAVRRRFGDAVGWLVIGACALTPAVTDGFVTLHYQGYAFALLLVEIGVCIGASPRAAPFALLGFLQGWLSFDYVFLVTFSPLAIELAMPRIDIDFQPRWKLTFTRAALAGVGFVVAHSLHFLQVAAYLGSVGEAARNLAGAASYRAGSEMFRGPLDYIVQGAANLEYYFYGLHPFSVALSSPDPAIFPDWSMFRFLGLSLGPWWLLVTAGLMIWERLKPGFDVARVRMNWHIVCLIGMTVSSLWVLVMVNHGLIHRHFLYRHEYLTFFLMVLFVSVTAHRLWVAKDRSAMAPVRHRPRGHVLTRAGGTASPDRS